MKKFIFVVVLICGCRSEPQQNRNQESKTQQSYSKNTKDLWRHNHNRSLLNNNEYQLCSNKPLSAFYGFNKSEMFVQQSNHFEEIDSLIDKSSSFTFNNDISLHSFNETLQLKLDGLGLIDKWVGTFRVRTGNRSPSFKIDFGVCLSWEDVAYMEQGSLYTIYFGGDANLPPDFKFDEFSDGDCVLITAKYSGMAPLQLWRCDRFSNHIRAIGGYFNGTDVLELRKLK